jgi:hypothetical protein
MMSDRVQYDFGQSPRGTPDLLHGCLGDTYLGAAKFNWLRYAEPSSVRNCLRDIETKRVRPI